MVFYSEFLAQEFLADEILHYLPYPVLRKALHILFVGNLPVVCSSAVCLRVLHVMHLGLKAVPIQVQ